MLEKSYIALSIIMLSIVSFGYAYYISKNITDKKLRLKKYLYWLVPVFLWLIYIGFLSYQEILFVVDLPPRFPLLLLLPLVLLFVLFYQKNKNNQILKSIPKEYVIVIQGFRIFVEILLYYTFVKGIIPVTPTFEGLNFDIIMGITAFPMAYLIYKNASKYADMLRYWNIFGIFLILFVALLVGSHFYFPQIWGLEERIIQLQFLKLPYLLIPTFLAPLGIFLHIVSLIQLKK